MVLSVVFSDTMDDADGDERGAFVSERQSVHLYNPYVVVARFLPQETVKTGVFGGEADSTEHGLYIGREFDFIFPELDEDLRELCLKGRTGQKGAVQRFSE